METYKRVIVIVLDSLGIGAMPDSEKFGDKGVDTFGHILDKMGTLDIPNLQKLGMLNLHKGGSMEGIDIIFIFADSQNNLKCFRITKLHHYLSAHTTRCRILCRDSILTTHNTD